MADSDSDHFESADEELSDIEEVKPSQSANSPSAVTSREPVANIPFAAPERHKDEISSTLQNLSLSKEKPSLERDPSGEQSLGKEENVSTTSATIRQAPGNHEVTPADDGTGKSSMAFKKEAEPSVQIPAKVVTTQSTPGNEDSIGCESDLLASPSDSVSKNANRYPSKRSAPNVPEPSIKPPLSALKDQSDHNSETLPQILPEEEKPCPASSAVIFSLESSDIISFNDGWDVDTFSDDDSTLQPTQSQLEGKVISTDLKSTSKSNLKETSLQRSQNVESESARSKDVNPQITPSTLPSESPSVFKTSLKSIEKNTSESLQNDGWEDDFEIEDDAQFEVKPSLEGPGVTLDSGIVGGDCDDGWDDGWDVEDVTPPPESSENQSKEDLQPSGFKKSLAQEGKKTTEQEKRDNVTKPYEPQVPSSKHIGAADQRVSQQQQQQSDGWFGWGVTNILSSATEGLSSITSNVTSAFESTIGAPDPIDILRAEKEQVGSNTAEASVGKESGEPQEAEGGSGLGSNLFSVSSWTKFVETTSNKVLTTGLDTLETIGKKTMEVLQEGDPGLKNKRAKLREFVSEPGKPVLSQVLREAKEKAETSGQRNEVELMKSRANFEILFDDFEGLVHLEALEMISKQCQIKLDSLALRFSGNDAKNFKETLQEIEELCEFPEEDEDNSKEAMADSGHFKRKVTDVLKELDVDINFTKLLETIESVENRFSADSTNPFELHRTIISSLAEICAAAMLIFHRTAEMLVIKEKHSTITETESLMSFGKLICSKLEVTADKFSSKLQKIDPTDTAKVSHISQEASNCLTYIQTACRLLLPILQYGAVV